jgi:hypothetical protein
MPPTQGLRLQRLTEALLAVSSVIVLALIAAGAWMLLR